MAEVDDLVDLARRIRKTVLAVSKDAGVGHIGSELSIVEIVAALYGQVLRRDDADPNERDRFVLSKGHAALTLYAALASVGSIDPEELQTYCGEDSRLGVHPETGLPGVDFSTGSLGQGLSVAAGAALAARLQGSRRRVFALLSDAECNEGATWEAVMFAAHHRLVNLTAVIDLNGQQALGYTRDVLSMDNMTQRWEDFGWDAVSVGGHDLPGLVNALEATSSEGKPRVVVAQTVFGRGVSFMESQIKWHYLPMSDDQFTQAMAEVSGGHAR